MDQGVAIVLADDSFIVREGVRMLLEGVGHTVVGVAEDLDGLLEAVAETQPDVVITDIRMPPTLTDEGILAARRIREAHPRVGVIVLSQYVEPEYALRLLEDGSEGLGYLLKERVGDIEKLDTAISTVCRGGSFIDPKVLDALVEARSQKPTSGIDSLSDRELQVLAHLATGKSNAAIAEAVFLSERGVEKNINAIFTKLDLLPERESNRRVLAALLYLAGQEG